MEKYQSKNNLTAIFYYHWCITQSNSFAQFFYRLAQGNYDTSLTLINHDIIIYHVPYNTVNKSSS